MFAFVHYCGGNRVDFLNRLARILHKFCFATKRILCVWLNVFQIVGQQITLTVGGGDMNSQAGLGLTCNRYTFVGVLCDRICSPVCQFVIKVLLFKIILY